MAGHWVGGCDDDAANLSAVLDSVLLETPEATGQQVRILHLQPRPNSSLSAVWRNETAVRTAVVLRRLVAQSRATVWTVVLFETHQCHKAFDSI